MKFRWVYLCLFLIQSCRYFENHDKVENIDVSYLESLGLFSEGEKLIWFDSQLTQKLSGNFLSDKRIASYWIDDNYPEKSYQSYFMLENVDSVRLKDKFKSISYASYFEVFSNGESLKVYVDKDSLSLRKYREEIEKLIRIK
jgi:hypothetical protein